MCCAREEINTRERRLVDDNNNNSLTNTQSERERPLLLLLLLLLLLRLETLRLFSALLREEWETFLCAALFLQLV